MTSSFEMPADPFVSNLHDVAPVAVWLHQGEGDPYAVLDTVGPVAAPALAAALATVPDGVSLYVLDLGTSTADRTHV